jgi:hypothetical protein
MGQNCSRLQGEREKESACERGCSERLAGIREAYAELSWRKIQKGDSGNKSAADAEATLRGLLFPYGFQIHANGRENRNVQDSEQVLRKILR